LDRAYRQLTVAAPEENIQQTVRVLEVFAEHLARLWERMRAVAKALQEVAEDQRRARNLMRRAGFTHPPNLVLVVKIEAGGRRRRADGVLRSGIRHGLAGLARDPSPAPGQASGHTKSGDRLLVQVDAEPGLAGDIEVSVARNEALPGDLIAERRFFLGHELENE